MSDRESNGLGTAGFVVSLVGIFATCGLLSPVGLTMSIVAMKREPKGLAIAGMVIGLMVRSGDMGYRLARAHG